MRKKVLCNRGKARSQSVKKELKMEHFIEGTKSRNNDRIMFALLHFE